MGKAPFANRGAVLNALAERLKNVGYTKTFLNLVVPDWWSDEAEQEPGALAELKATLGKRIGLDIGTLLTTGATVPVSPAGIHFKRSAAVQDQPPSDPTLAFCGVVGRALGAVSQPSKQIPRSADEIRGELLRDEDHYVSLEPLLRYCWAHNIAVAHVAEMPTARKGMEALTARFNGRNVIIMTRRSHIDAWAAFHLAHELGHIALDHVGENEVFIDEESESKQVAVTREEQDADRFAADLLGGSNIRDFWSRYDETPQSMANAVVSRAAAHQVDPAHVILRYARRSGNYRFANAALKFLPQQPAASPGKTINSIALENIDFSQLPTDIAEVVAAALHVP